MEAGKAKRAYGVMPGLLIGACVLTMLVHCLRGKHFKRV
jgi:hypothetical protein